MEEHQSVPPEIAELQTKSARVEGIIAKKQTVAATIGTPEFQGPERYIPPPPEHPNYLKELVATTLASSRVRNVIEHRSLPALEQIHRSLQEEITHRQQLLSDAAEYTMNLHELRELDNKGVLTNQSVIGMVEEALRKIDEELHSQPVLAQRTPGNANIPPAFSPASNPETVARGVERPARAPEAIEEDKLSVLRQLADGLPLPQLLDELSKDSVRRFTDERAERLLHGIFTKLYGRVTRGEADEEEVRTWQDISGRVPSLEAIQIRDDFRDYMARYFHAASPAAPRAERRKPEPREKKPIDPSALIHQVLERVTGRGTKLNMNQRFNPPQVKEVFGAHRQRDEIAVEKDLVRPKKREGNDYHASYSLVEAIQMAVIPRYSGATRDQLEELPILIELELEKWAKEHPEVISAK